MNLVILSKYCHRYAEYLTHSLPTGVTLLGSHHDPAELVATDKVEILLGDPDLCAAIVPQCSNLRWIQSTWAGVRPLLDVARPDLVLTGIKDVFGKQMREYVFNYMLHFSRRTEAFSILQRQRLWQPPETDSLYGKTLAIAGVGSIGKEVAKLAKAFDMRVIGLTRQSRDCEYVDQYFNLEHKAEFAAQADYLLILLPHTPDTEKLIDHKVFAAIKTGAVVINAGRAATLDCDELVAALEAQRVRAAVLDVFEQEPLTAQSPLWQQQNLLITQHTSAVSKIDEVAEIFLSNLVLFSEQQNLHYQVNWQNGY